MQSVIEKPGNDNDDFSFIALQTRGTHSESPSDKKNFIASVMKLTYNPILNYF